MQHTLLITGSPYHSKACHSALRFVNAAVSMSPDSIKGVFFYEDAVLIGNALAQPPRDEIHLTKAWQEIAVQHNIPLYLCIAAAVRRGVISESESQRYGLNQSSLAEHFQLEGLGTLVDLMNTTHKLIQFR
ncbi:sulfurtransferase complex subunit TusD [Marinomonas sp. IMCC 4694]|uniref:sulfurtransferase complex subunit TusD n=1 Tax=Marinomonas sp. IMCC 4694 TaxID=2605432 RepID=UPI0011E7A6C3|nr:sulfurtransferase complex subunit TusD [Marinomonas sp. IMCC 4694]TYL47397.1 sulfurtransferase complex subunit TusD [Marinomonas sp. IMCC 4694]